MFHATELESVSDAIRLVVWGSRTNKTGIEQLNRMFREGGPYWLTRPYSAPAVATFEPVIFMKWEEVLDRAGARVIIHLVPAPK
jgi:hypothetical protein